MTKIKLGISTCLLGEPVRYDGGHKLDRYLTEVLGQFVEYVPVCPEVECGLPVPREPMHLEGSPESPRLVTTRTRGDLTEKMVAWAKRKTEELESENLCGFIFKSNSPSSGMERVRIHDEKGAAKKRGTGIFAGIFMSHFPLVPVEDEGRLHDPAIRENFIERLFAYSRWQETARSSKFPAGLIDFHARHKLLIMSHSPKHCAILGKLAADPAQAPRNDLLARYAAALMEALKLKATSSKNTNVLQHMAGYFKKDLSPDEKQELQELIEQYRSGLLPLIVPQTLIKHYARKYDKGYLKSQHYLSPHPAELQLRNHV